METTHLPEDGTLLLSNPGQLELLRGFMERRVSLRMTALGHSMAPFLRDRDVLTIHPVVDTKLRLGDVVAVELPESGRLAIHRLVARSGDDWLLRGDNCAQSDGTVGGDSVIGRVIRAERNGRQIRLGLGRERAIVAELSRFGVLRWLVRPLRMVLHLVRRET